MWLDYATTASCSLVALFTALFIKYLAGLWINRSETIEWYIVINAVECTLLGIEMY